MIVVKVTYTVKSEFVQKNEENIRAFMKDFRKLNSAGFRYSAYVCDDKKTFVHLSMYKNEEIQKQVLAIDSFTSFQQQRDERGLEGPHKVETMKLVASSFDVFN
jgi:hypothetical protein